MRLIVCGGRDFDNVPLLWRVLDRVDRKHDIRCIIDGAQQKWRQPDNAIVGADYWAHQWALARNKPTGRFHADWDGEGRSAGPKRNRRMRDEGKPDMVLAAPGGNGTRDMCEAAKEKGLPVYTFDQDGEIHPY